MARLLSELQRLYFPHPTEPAVAAITEASGDTDGHITSLIDPAGMLRAMILEIGSPANWEPASAVWRGVQRELGLPAPAIAVSGVDGFQLWFSLTEAVPVLQAHAFLNALRMRFLADIAPRHIRLMPGLDLAAQQSLSHETVVPARQPTGNWSAFVAPDLAPIFVETPWLDIAPSDDGQADLLRGIRSIQRAEWESAQEQLGLAPPAAAIAQPEPPPAAPGVRDTNGAASNASQDPRQFLLKVMNDDAAPLALRIESAKALLQFPEERSAPQRD